VLSAKDEADVAADIKVLVFGSMVVGAAGGRPRRRRHVRQGPCERRRRRDEINEEESSAMAAPVDAGYGWAEVGRLQASKTSLVLAFCGLAVGSKTDGSDA